MPEVSPTLEFTFSFFEFLCFLYYYFQSMSSYAIMVGTGYLHRTLFEPMQKLSVLAEIQAPEFDPTENDKEDLALSKDVLQLMSRLIFTALTKSVPNVPTYVILISDNAIKIQNNNGDYNIIYPIGNCIF